MLAIIVVAAVVVIGSLYVAQQDETGTRDQVQLFHLESRAELDHLEQDAQTLHNIILARLNFPVTDQSTAAGITSMQIGFRGLLHSIRSRVMRVAALQDMYGGPTFAATSERLSNQFDRIDLALHNSEPTLETARSIAVLSSTIQQYERLHAIAADLELHELANRQTRTPRFLGVLIACLGFSGLTVWYLINSLRASLRRQKETELALAESQEHLYQIQKLDALGLLAGGIAHDFNNLLTAIIGHTNILQDIADGDERLEADLQVIETASTRAASLTREFLAFSRRQPSDSIVLNLNTSIKNIETMLQKIVGANISLVCNYEDDLCDVELDPDQLQQVIMNLVGNARDAMSQGGLLTVATENAVIGKTGIEIVGVPDGKYARLCVSDSGTGMDDDTLKRLFDPYFTTKERGRGTGLGLSTVHGIVTGSGGYIDVKSQQGDGSQVYLYFPCAHSSQ